MAGQTGVIVTLDGEFIHAGCPAAARRRPRRGSRRRRLRDAVGPRRRPCLVESHLQRLTQSAKLMDLPEPDLPAGAARSSVATRQWAAGTADEGAMRLVYSRGRESGSAPTAYVMVNAVPERVPAVRRDGAGRGDLGPRTARRRYRRDAVAAGRRQDAVVRGQHGRLASCRPAGRRRRHLRQLGRLHPGRPALDGGDRDRRRAGAAGACAC